MVLLYIILFFMGLLFLIAGARDIIIWYYKRQQINQEWKDLKQWERFTSKVEEYRNDFE
jgi:hypothetical protein